jgi:hypothetical protein
MRCVCQRAPTVGLRLTGRRGTCWALSQKDRPGSRRDGASLRPRWQHMMSGWSLGGHVACNAYRAGEEITSPIVLCCISANSPGAARTSWSIAKAERMGHLAGCIRHHVPTSQRGNQPRLSAPNHGGCFFMGTDRRLSCASAWRRSRH